MEKIFILTVIGCLAVVLLEPVFCWILDKFIKLTDMDEDKKKAFYKKEDEKNRL